MLKPVLAIYVLGTLSAWYVWGALGLFPLPATSTYFIGSPAVKKAVIHLSNGNDFIPDSLSRMTLKHPRYSLSLAAPIARNVTISIPADSRN